MIAMAGCGDCGGLAAPDGSLADGSADAHRVDGRATDRELSDVQRADTAPQPDATARTDSATADDAALPDSAIADHSLPDTEAAHGDAVVADARSVDGWRADTTIPDQRAADTARADATVTDVAEPDVGPVRDAWVADALAGDSAVVDSAPHADAAIRFDATLPADASPLLDGALPDSAPREDGATWDAAALDSDLPAPSDAAGRLDAGPQDALLEERPGADAGPEDAAAGDAATVAVDLCATSQCIAVTPTSQTQCYAWASPWGTVSCPGLAGQVACGTTVGCGQDAQYASRSRSYTCHNADGMVQIPCDAVADNNEVVTDSLTGLMWQRTLTSSTWQGAMDYCTVLDYGGFDDWRLPNPFELQSIVELGRYNPAIDDTVFPATPANYFWSSASYVADSSAAWLVDFMYGYVYHGADKSFRYDVRCARGGP